MIDNLSYMIYYAGKLVEISDISNVTGVYVSIAHEWTQLSTYFGFIRCWMNNLLELFFKLIVGQKTRHYAQYRLN